MIPHPNPYSNPTLNRICAVLRWLAGSLASALILPLIALLLSIQPARAACSIGACVSAGPRLASVSTAQSALLGPLLSSLTGTNISLTAADWNALAQGDVNLLGVLNALHAGANVSSPSQALAANVTLAQVAAALQAQAQAQANTSLSGALSRLQGQLAVAGATVRLADLLQVSAEPAALANTAINSLDMLSGLVQLYNRRNVLSTPTPVGVSGGALGMAGVVNSLLLSAQVIESPVYICGPAGSSFHSAAVRVKLKLDLVTLSPATTALTAIPGVYAASIAISKLDVYIESARGDGALSAVDAAAKSVTLQVTPGVADAYIGSIADEVFFNRTRTLSASDVGYGVIGQLILNGAKVDIRVKSAARGQAPFATSVTMSGAFPQTRTVSTSTAFATNLAGSLMNNLDLTIAPSLGLLDAAVLPVLKTLVVGALNPVLAQILTGIADPLLQLLGIGLGQMVVTVDGICQACDDFKLTKAVDKTGAAPGSTITYTIAYTNTGTATLSGLKITDTTPPFTTYAASTCGPLPPGSGLTGCNVASSPAPGASGAVEWRFSGTLAPGATGQVTVTVTIQ
ncbi:DUF11 domain-containing protein [Massilia sp. 9096]|uniref:DUF7507 domain-containing protein n=1 Tax=Massilia sp. 9096 TaxID=1500894 RepID=UPI00055CBF21|nr:DUF11 domain-containing protein [Massilia sp. 9096]